MSVPALRQPKQMIKRTTAKPAILPSYAQAQQFVFVTLKDEKRLVVSSDSYHGILTVEGIYKCVFCAIDLEVDARRKELHTNSLKHKVCMEDNPFIEELSEHLVRKLNTEEIYCTICNVIVSTPFFERHISSEVHQEMLARAKARASSYTL